jgi:hypothetical protein
MTQISLTAIRNNNLFSQYYLDTYLKQSPEWKRDDHIAVFEQIKALYAREAAFLEPLNEKQLEERFFKPVFTLLGHIFEVTAGTQSRDIPDYGFFSERKALDDAHQKKDQRDFYTNAIAIGEVKQWKIDLDRIGTGNMEPPSRQIWRYLSVTDPRWGILSNGKLWRLYCKNRRYDSYLEINLPDLIATNDTEGFRFFYYFFRKEAFVSSKDGQAFLDRVLKGSIDYATSIGSSLKKNVYWAMKRIAEGLVERRSNNLDKNDPAVLSRVQNSTMILLYRFLFLLYAEGKGLLDLNDPRYLNYYSFRHIVRDVAERQDGSIDKKYDPVNITLQTQLETLFNLINQGSAGFPILEEGEGATKIPAYNGGLFDPEKHPDLERWEIGDQYLAEAIDYLSRSEMKEGHRDFVDYSTLEIRHLGSIYEGLLEYNLRIAQTDLVVRDEGWVTLDEYNKGRKQKKIFTDFTESDRVKAGHIYLATDKGERKSTGSYYTPDYIVNYIVKNTVGPIVDEKWKEADEKGTSYIDATLSINVLDPAMGSGHFLVGAVDFLSQKLIDAVQKDCKAGRVTDTTPYTNDWARRDVVSHCIYGVDLNELAVELAKVGLWLTTISRDKPLSFLDHRLKQGNSLIGVNLSSLRYYPGSEPKGKGQVELPTSISPRFIGHILSKIAELEAIEDNKLEDVKRKEKAFEEFKQLPEYRKAKGLANVYTATYFGNAITSSEATELKKARSSEAHYQDLVWEIAGDEEYKWKRVTNYEWYRRAESIGQEKSFFHWELEFPEIFFDAGKLRENPGWDAIIGNPPYSNAWAMTDLDDVSRNAIAVLNPHKEFLTGHWDLYIPFVGIGLKLIKKGGYHSFILPDAVAREKYAATLRVSIIHDFLLTRWVHFDDENVFEGVSRHCAIYVIQKEVPPENWEVFFDNAPHQNELDRGFSKIPLSKWLVGPTNQLRPNNVESGSSTIVEKIDARSNRVGQYCYVMVGATVHSKDKVSFKKADIVTTNPVGNAKRFIDGKTLKRYEICYDGRFLDYKPDMMYGPRVPDLFENQKIIIRKVSEENEGLVVAFDTDGYYCDDRIICVTPYENVKNAGVQLGYEGYPHLEKDEPSLLFTMGCVASKLTSWYFKAVFATGTLQGSYTDTYPKQVRAFPIRRISFNTPADRRSSLLNEVKVMYNAFTETNDSQPLLSFINARLLADPEEADVIHDIVAFLTQQMIDMYKAKDAEISAFLKFIEDEIGVPIDTLSNKTAVQDYYTHDFSKFIEILVKNKGKIKEGYNPKSRTHHEILEGWYNSSVSKLSPLLSKIESTDCLINQIVYRLYGLTEQEISVIEGNGK